MARKVFCIDCITMPRAPRQLPRVGKGDAESNNKRHTAAKTRSMSTKKKTIINLSSFSSESSESEEEDSELVTTTKMLQELNDEKLRKVQQFIQLKRLGISRKA